MNVLVMESVERTTGRRSLHRLVRCGYKNHFTRFSVTTVSPTVRSCNSVAVRLTMVFAVSGTPVCRAEGAKLNVSLLPWTRQGHSPTLAPIRHSL